MAKARIGRPPNKLRAAALKAGKLTFEHKRPCAVCGSHTRYVSNYGCVECAVERGCARYDAIKDDDAARLHYNRHHYTDAAE